MSATACSNPTRTLFAPLGTDSVAGLTFGPDKNLYIAVDTSTNRGHGYVLRYDLKRSKLGTFIPPSEGGLEMPIGGRFGPNGDYYLSNNLLAGTYDQLRRYGGQTGQLVSWSAHLGQICTCLTTLHSVPMACCTSPMCH
jgi:hypothetical protein